MPDPRGSPSFLAASSATSVVSISRAASSAFEVATLIWFENSDELTATARTWSVVLETYSFGSCFEIAVHGRGDEQHDAQQQQLVAPHQSQVVAKITRMGTLTLQGWAL